MSFLVTALFVLSSASSSVHALLNKQDPRSALGWVVLCIAVPFIGPILYLLLGVNRSSAAVLTQKLRSNDNLEVLRNDNLDHPLDQVTSRLSRYPCSRGNHVQILRNGEQAYPAMLDAIENAQQSILLCTYIFDSDEMGETFVAALAKSVARGVQVRVLIDSVGSLYSFPSAIRLLRKARVPTSRFLPMLHRNSWQFNMRNHRKMLIVDGVHAFTGGMNIGSRHLVSRRAVDSTEDVQFLIEGNVAESLADMFARDWEFATGESLQLSYSQRTKLGDTACRPISDGPGADIGTLPRLLLGLIGTATDSITIVTPYFLPPPSIAGALIGASLRGVRIRILIPEHTNLPYVTWATEHALAPFLQSSIEVYLQPRPFSHTKMLLIDEDFLQIGSYNMDSRSLRLNFELAVNMIDRDLRHDIDHELEERFANSVRVDAELLDRRGLPTRIRNAVFWLFTPYL